MTHLGLARGYAWLTCSNSRRDRPLPARVKRVDAGRGRRCWPITATGWPSINPSPATTDRSSLFNRSPRSSINGSSMERK